MLCIGRPTSCTYTPVGCARSRPTHRRGHDRLCKVAAASHQSWAAPFPLQPRSRPRPGRRSVADCANGLRPSPRRLPSRRRLTLSTSWRCGPLRGARSGLPAEANRFSSASLHLARRCWRRPVAPKARRRRSYFAAPTVTLQAAQVSPPPSSPRPLSAAPSTPSPPPSLARSHARPPASGPARQHWTDRRGGVRPGARARRGRDLGRRWRRGRENCACLTDDTDSGALTRLSSAQSRAQQTPSRARGSEGGDGRGGGAGRGRSRTGSPSPSPPPPP